MSDNFQIEQYKELCNYARHLDRSLWLAPTAAFTITLLGLKSIFEIDAHLVRVTISILNVVIFLGFLYQFARYKAYLVKNEKDIKKIETSKEVFKSATHMSGLEYTISEKDDWYVNEHWYIKLSARLSAATFMFYVMLCTLLIHSIVSVSCIVNWIRTF